MATCNKLSLSLVPITTTNVRLPVKKINYTSSDKKVTVTRNGVTIQYLVPCILLPYIDELQQNLNQMTIQKAIYATALNHEIVIQQQQSSIQRYQYGVVTAKPHPLDYSFNDIFVLYSDATSSVTLPQYTVIVPEYTCVQKDAKYIKVINDDGKTYSTSFEDIKKNKIFGNLITKLPCTVMCSTNTKYKRIQFGLLFLENETDSIIYLPFHYNKLKLYYFSLPIDTSVLFDNIGMPVNHILDTVYPQLATNGSISTSIQSIYTAISSYAVAYANAVVVYNEYLAEVDKLVGDINYDTLLLSLNQTYVQLLGVAPDNFISYLTQQQYPVNVMNALLGL